MRLGEIRKASGRTSDEVRRKMGLRYDRSLLRAEAEDAHSTRYLSDYARAVGARLSITFTFADGTVCPLDFPPPSRVEEGETRMVYPKAFIARRKRKGLLLKDVADLARLNYGNLSEIESGKIVPEWATLYRIGKVLGYQRDQVKAAVASEIGRQNSEEGVALLRAALARFERATLDMLLFEQHNRGLDAWLERRRGMSDITLERVRRINELMQAAPSVSDEWLRMPNPALPDGQPPIVSIKLHRDGLKLVLRLLEADK